LTYPNQTPALPPNPPWKGDKAGLGPNMLLISVAVVLFMSLFTLFRYLDAENKFGIQSDFTAPQSTFSLIEDDLYGIIIFSPFVILSIMWGISSPDGSTTVVMLLIGLLLLIYLCFMVREIFIKIKEQKASIKKFGTSYLINDSYIFDRGETVGLFFQNDNLIKYADTIMVTLRNIEEKPMNDGQAMRQSVSEGKFFSHFEQSRQYDFENNKIGLVLEIPKEEGFETEYGELEVKNEECGFHHRFIIVIHDTEEYKST